MPTVVTGGHRRPTPRCWSASTRMPPASIAGPGSGASVSSGDDGGHASWAAPLYGMVDGAAEDREAANRHSPKRDHAHGPVSPLQSPEPPMGHAMKRAHQHH